MKLMVQDGFSNLQIKSYLRRYCYWWVNATETWNYQQLLNWFINACWDHGIASIARGLIAAEAMPATSSEHVPVAAVRVIPL